MTLKELWMASPQSFIFIKNKDGKVAEYTGTKDLANRIVENVTATSYPMYRSVIEVRIKEEVKKPVSETWKKQKAYMAKRAQEIGAEMDKAIESGDWNRFYELRMQAHNYMNRSQKAEYFRKFAEARKA